MTAVVDRPEGFRRVGAVLAHAGRVAVVTGPLGRAGAGFVSARTGFVIGGVTPVGHSERPLILIDRELHRFEVIWAAAGHPNGVFQLTPRQLVAHTGAPVHDVVQSS